jgi:hypothetical protein
MELEEGTTATTRSIPRGGVFARSAFTWTVSPTGNRRDDGEFVGCSDRGGFFFGKITKIFVVEIDVDEGAELALVAEELLLQIGILGGEVGEDLSDGCTGDGDRLGSCGVSAERSWDVNVHA